MPNKNGKNYRGDAKDHPKYPAPKGRPKPGQKIRTPASSYQFTGAQVGDRQFTSEAEADRVGRTTQYLASQREALGRAGLYEQLLGGGSTSPGGTYGASSGGGRGGGGGGGVGASRKQAAIDSIKSYYAAMQGVPTRSADALSALLTNARQLVDPKVASTREALAAQPNAMAELAAKLQPATQASNPLAEYLAAAGAGSGVSDSLVQLLNAGNQQVAAGQSNLVNTLAQSEASAQQSRLADVDQAALNFAMNLQNREVQGRAAIEEENAARKQQLMDTILQLAAQYGVDLNAIGVKF